jgi:Carboxypeptidase regulatory-like domain/Secretion system C-terminal sorting domain/von Willebrand factor type A domain
MQKIIYVLGCLFAANILFAQSTGIQGKVTDAKGEALIGVSISATNTAAGTAKFGTITDVDGKYRLIMPIGTYSVDVSYVGYQTKKSTKIEVKKGLVTYDFVLEESAPLSEVVILGSRPVTISKDVSSGATVTTSEIRSIPATPVGKSAKKSAPRGAADGKPSAKPSEPTRSSAPTAAGVATTMAPPPPVMERSMPSSTKDMVAADRVVEDKVAKARDARVEYDKRGALKKESEKLSSVKVTGSTTVIEESSTSYGAPREADYTVESAKTAPKDIKKIDKVELGMNGLSKKTFLEDATETAKNKAAADAAKAAADADESLPDEPEQKAGQLTAGEWSDLKNWNFWMRSIDTAFSTHHKNWKYNFDDRYSVNVVGSENQPIADAQVRLLATDGSLVWESRTDNHGNAELWSGLFGGKYTNLVFKVLHNGKTFDFKNAKTFKTSVNTLKINASCSGLMALDIAFVVDATGSMGDEIAYLKSEVVDVIRRVKMNNQSLEIRTASVFYRDFTDEYVTKIFPFGKSLKQNLAFIRNQSANGGGDFEEAVPEGLEAGIDSLKWSENALARIMFLILDAPPHLTPENIEKLHRLTQKAAQKGIRIIPITASGIDKNVEYLMKSLGVTTGGTYVFLTDDSGIGGGHIKATTEKHEVEHLNDLMVRLIKDATDTETCRKIAEKASTGGDAILDASFKLSPTPASSIVYVDMKNDIESLRITNVHGQIMEDLYDLKAGTKEIAVSTWASGVYYATIKQGKTVSTKKFSVIR